MGKKEPLESKTLFEMFDGLLPYELTKDEVLRSPTDIARVLKLNAGSMRDWFRDDRFPEDVAKQIAALLKIDPSTLPDRKKHPEQYTKDTGRKRKSVRTFASFKSALAALDQACTQSYPGRSAAAEADINNTICKLIDTMGRRNVWVFTIQTRIPSMLTEADGDRFAAHLCSAISRGMHVAVVVPTKSYIETVISPYQLDNYAPYDSLISKFRSLRTRLIRHLGDRGNMAPADTADSRLQLYETENLFFTPPGCVVSLLGYASAPNTPILRLLREDIADPTSLGLLLAPSSGVDKQMSEVYVRSIIAGAAIDEAWRDHVVKLGVYIADEASSAIHNRNSFRKHFSQIRRASSEVDYTSQ